VPEGARMGAQRALLHGRLDFAREHGCDVASMVVEPGARRSATASARLPRRLHAHEVAARERAVSHGPSGLIPLRAKPRRSTEKPGDRNMEIEFFKNCSVAVSSVLSVAMLSLRASAPEAQRSLGLSSQAPRDCCSGSQCSSKNTRHCSIAAGSAEKWSPSTVRPQTSRWAARASSAVRLGAQAEVWLLAAERTCAPDT
jgi:hypothetical protein